MVKVVIAGCGFGGIDVAVSIKKKLGSKVSVLAINKSSYHTLNGALPEVISRKMSISDVNVPLGPYFRIFGVEFMKDTITTIDPKKKVLHTKEHGEVHFDYLLIDMGKIPNDFGIVGLRDHAFALKPVERCVALADHIEKQFKQYHHMDAKKRVQAMSFTVGGAGFSGIEVMTEIVDLTKELAKQYRVPLHALSYFLLDAAPDLAGPFGRRTGKKLERILEKKNIRLMLSQKITKVEKESIHLGEDHIIPCRTLVWAGGFKAHPLLKESGFTVDNSGAIIVDDYLRAKEFPYIFATGDDASFVDPHTHRSVANTALVAVIEEPVVVKNICASIEGAKLQRFSPKKNYAYYLTLGGNNAMWIYGKISFTGKFFYRLKHRIHSKYASKYFEALDPTKRKHVIKQADHIEWGT